jgi:HEAT repeat protein
MDSADNDPRNVADGPARRRLIALAGHRGDVAAARAALSDDDPSVCAAAVAALGRAGAVTAADLGAAVTDPAPDVRRRACEVAADTKLAAPAVRPLLDDLDPTVVEVAAWALGELEDHEAVAALARVATEHDDALAREAAVAALGAIGDPAGLPAILVGTRDKPAVRRRAVLALAPFDGPEVDEALARATEDRDWQVREAADLLLRADDPPNPDDNP